MMASKSFVFKFDNVVVREREFVLLKSGKPLTVEPKAFRVLLFLLHNPQKLISKEELLNSVWPDVEVTEGSLTRCIWLLRSLLGDDIRSPRYIETVATVGYRFVCPVEASEDGLGNLNAPEKSTVGNGSSRRVGKDGAIAAAVVVIVGVAFICFRTFHGHTARQQARPAFSNMHITPLTSHPGIYWGPTFSPDGKQIAFFWNDSNPARGDLYVQLVGGDKALRLTHTSTGFVCCADWSPDGLEIAFTRCDDSGGGVFIMPALGGFERKLTDVACVNFGVGVNADVRWTADGKSLVLTERCAPDSPRGIVVFSLQTGEKRCLHSPPVGDSGDTDLALSPDEKTVAFLRWPTSGLAEICTVAFSGGNLRQLRDEFFDQDRADRSLLATGVVGGTLMWSGDGKYITFERARDRMARVAASGGPVEFEAVYPKIGELSRDRRRLVYIEPALVWRWSPAVSRINLTHAGGRVVSQARILLSATGGNDSAQLSPHGNQLVFASMRSGTHQIWKSNLDGSDPLQLTSFDQGYPGTPRWSPDGKWIVFDFHGRAHSQIYLVDSEGRNLHALTSGSSEDCVPSWSRDGNAIYFASDRTGNLQVWRRELSSGNETQVTRHGGFAAFESYDAKTIYYSRYEGGGIWKIPVGGGQEDRVTNSLHLGYWGHFAVTDNGLYLVDSDAKGGPAIMYYNFQTGRLSLVLTFTQYPTPWFPNLAASRDGRMLFYAPVEFQSTMISMVENFQ
jgi:Tol biopolymer transport system component/DNA-binding winged helix-turn-helix (wHTH) protein